MKKITITRGILPLFRIFVLIRLVWSIFGLLIMYGRLNLVIIEWSILATLGECLLLLGYLFSSWLENRLKQFYLPVGLIIATIGPWLESIILLNNLPAALLLLPHHTDISINLINTLVLLASQLQLACVLLIPLILISWQYRLKWVVIYSLGMTLMDFIQIFLIISPRKEEIGGIPFAALVMTGQFLIIGFMVNRLSHEQKERNRQLSHYADTLEHLTTSRERNRIAREIHDTLAHTLSGLAVNLEAVAALWDNDAKQAKEILLQSLGVTRNGLVETRRAIQALRAGPLEDLGLILALKQEALSSADRYGLKVELNLPSKMDNLDPAVEQCIYRIAEESIRNTCQHAQASRFSLSLACNENNLEMELSDDGRGFAANGPEKDNHFGLKGMQERAEMVGGLLNISSRESGTTIKFILENFEK